MWLKFKSIHINRIPSKRPASRSSADREPEIGVNSHPAAATVRVVFYDFSTRRRPRNETPA